MNHRQKWIAIVASICVAALEGSPATATTLKALSLSQLADRSDAVVRATVGGSYSEWRGSLIYTVTEIQIDKVLVGTAPDIVRVAQLGGRVEDHAMPVLGTADLATGEDVVLFLHLNPELPGEYFISGMSQGKLLVRADASLVWAPTAMLWDRGQLRSPTPRLLSLRELMRSVGGAL